MNLDNIQIFIRSKTFLLILGAGIFFTLIIFLITPRGDKPVEIQEAGGPSIRTPAPEIQVIRVEPLPDSNNISISPTISITFKKPILNKDVQITSSPKVSFKSSLSPEGFVLELIPKTPLLLAKKYTLGVVYEKVKIFSWSFTTGKKQVDANVLEKIKAELPYDGNNFRITYIQASDKFYIVVDAKPVATYNQAALNWFAEKGLPDAESKINIFYYFVGDAVDPNF